MSVATVPVTSQRNGSMSPSIRPWRMARRMIRRSTYPRHSLDGVTPSVMRKAAARAWSAITRMETSSSSRVP